MNKLRFGDIDLITGMEINRPRQSLFDFSASYYRRYDVVFIRADDGGINGIEDLFSKIITGDRHSFVETDWRKRGIKNKIRIMQTESKEASMRLLQTGTTRAAIMPKAVGFHIAHQIGLQVVILENTDPGSPVAMAVKKGDRGRLMKIDAALKALIETGEIARLYQKWVPEP